MRVPALQFLVDNNPTPEPITYPALRAILETFCNDLASATQALEAVGNDDVAIVVDLPRIRLDLKGRGKLTDEDTLQAASDRVLRPSHEKPAPPTSLEVKFDTGDAAWFAAYSHGIMALCDFMLAHDFRHAFGPISTIWFPKSKVRPWDLSDFPRWPLTDVARMNRARQHIKAMFALSRKSWTLIFAETDDREWIANPRQAHSAMGWQVTQRQFDSWMSSLDDADAILDGRLLVLFPGATRGLDVRSLFDSPETLYLLGIWDAGATSYLRDGPVISSERWQQLERTFGRGFFLFAFWHL